MSDKLQFVAAQRQAEAYRTSTWLGRLESDPQWPVIRKRDRSIYPMTSRFKVAHPNPVELQSDGNHKDIPRESIGSVKRRVKTLGGEKL